MCSKFNSMNIGALGTLDARSLIENLKNGELSISSAINQISSIVREVLRVIEEHSEEQTKANLDRKLKVDRMDKIINDLSEKCQGMQQALLYKEEKYDEKCREVERYKVICELSAKAVVSDNPYYTSHDQNNNNNSQDCKDGIVKLESQHCDQSTDRQDGMRKITKGHVKLSQSFAPLKRFADPIRPESPRSCVNMPMSTYNDDDRRSLMACHYAGGPSRRQILTNSVPSFQQDSRLKDRLENIGAINVRGQRIEQGPVQMAKLYRPHADDSFADDRNKRVKISLSGQSNEVLSSAGDNAYQTKQNSSENDHHRHIPCGIWTKMSGRRKKEWPF